MQYFYDVTRTTLPDFHCLQHLSHLIVCSGVFFHLPTSPSFRSLPPLSQDGSCDLLLWVEQADDEAVWSEGMVVWEGVWTGAVLWGAHV